MATRSLDQPKRVLTIDSKGTATVSTNGLSMIVRQPGNKVIQELCERSEAEAYAEAFNRYNRSGEVRVEVVDYAEAYRRQLKRKRLAKLAK